MGRADQTKRLDYLCRAFEAPDLHGRLCYAVFRNTKDYEKATIEAIARAIRYLGTANEQKIFLYIDALAKSKRRTYGARLRSVGVSPYKVQGVTKDENNALVRLADAVAGFVRDALDGESAEILALFGKAKEDEALIEV